MGLAMAMAMHCTRMLSRLSVPTRVAAILITQICPPLNLCILATLFQEIYLKSEGLSTLFWIKRVEHANFEKLLQYFQNNAKIVQSLLAVKASTNIFPQNLFPTKTGVNTVRGPQLRGPKHLRVQWIWNSCCMYWKHLVANHNHKPHSKRKPLYTFCPYKRTMIVPLSTSL